MTRTLITVNTLRTLVREQGRVDIPADALITPAARDWLQGARVPVQYGVQTASPIAVGPTHYLIGDGRKADIQTLVPTLERQYPGLQFRSCEGKMGRLLDVLRQTCEDLATDCERRAVVVVREGASISIVANKYAQVRAAILPRPSDLFTFQRELGVNLLILERERTSLAQMRAAIDALFTGPAELAPVVAAALKGNATTGQADNTTCKTCG